VVLFLLLVVGTVWAAGVIVNGDFESGLEPPWYFGEGPGYHLVETTMEQVHSGSWAVSFYISVTEAHIEQVVDLTSGISYTLSFWSFSDGVHSPLVTLEGQDELPCSINVSELAEWSRHECIFSVSTSGGYELQLEVYDSNNDASSATGFFDAVCLADDGSCSIPTTNASTCLMLLLIKLSVAMVVFFAVVSLGMWLGQINIF
jgi:hypothetical protein